MNGISKADSSFLNQYLFILTKFLKPQKLN